MKHGKHALLETRRLFLHRASLLALAPLALSVQCTQGDDSPDPTAPGNNAVEGAVSANHGHVVSITQQQLQAGQTVTLILTQGAGHTHTLTLSATQVQDIAAGTTVTETSSREQSHSHEVTFS
ncbi:MAG: hypothetical protein GF398_02665 [Chitinivibrionales bacterium]|nr:hypothetical protein [Chitinivibrionales bacterium]